MSLAPELRSATGVGYEGIAVLFVAQTVGCVLGAFATSMSCSPLVRPVPMTLLVAGSALLTITVDDAVALAPLLLVAGFGCYAVNARAQGFISVIAGATRARHLAIFHTCGGAVFALFPLCVAGLLRAGAGWHAPFVLVAVFFGAYAFVARRWNAPSDPTRFRLSALHEVARGRAGAALLVACVGTGLQFAFPLWIPTLAHDRFGWSTSAASVTAAIYMGALLASRLLAVAIVTRVSGRRILVWGATLVVLGHVALAVAWSSAGLVVAAVAVGGGVGPILPIGIARVAHWSGNDQFGTGLVMGLSGIAQIVMPAIVVAAHAGGLSLQHAAALTVFPALLVLLAARKA